MFDWLESTSLALWVKESWGWPLALTIHTFGSATIAVGAPKPPPTMTTRWRGVGWLRERDIG